jgi:hypothetical protein
VTGARFILTRAATGAFVATVALSLPLPGFAHEGHEHAAVVKPANVRLAPRFETRSEDLEIVGVLAGKELVLYVDGAADNAPIQGAQIDVDGQGINGVATEMAGGVYRLAAASLARPGKHALTISVQAGEIVDLLAANLEVEEAAAAATTDGHALRVWWLVGGIASVLLSGGLIAWRLRRRAQ